MTSDTKLQSFVEQAKPLLWPALMFYFGFAAVSSLQFHAVLLEFHHNFSANDIGNALMLASATQFVMPFLILKLGKTIPNPARILTFLLAIYTICLLVLPHLTSKKQVLACYTLMFFCQHGIFPLQMTAVLTASQHLKDGWFLFIRSIGTLGFSSFCLFSSILATTISVPELYNLFAFAGFLSFLLSFGNKQLPQQAENLQISSGIKKLTQGKTPIYLLAVSLGNMAMFAGTSLLGNFAQHEIGASAKTISLSWTTSTFMEVPLIWISIWLLRKMPLLHLMVLGLLAGSLRFGLTYLATTELSFILAQLLHGFFYGATLSGIPLLLRRTYGTKDLHALQLFASLAYGGVAGTIGGKLAGVAWSYVGLRNFYLYCSAICVLAAIILWTWGREKYTASP
jgi:predicted MFS family arabinose efflux permease